MTQGFTKQGSEFSVNTHTTNSQSDPSVTTLGDGGFVVTWESEAQDGDSWGIYGQRYDAAGAVSGAEFLVNTYTTNRQADPSVTALADGGFVVTWNSIGQDGDGHGIYGQRYDAAGAVSGVEFQVNTHTTSHQYNSSVTALDDGGFVVTWESYNQDGSNYGVYGQRYDAAGVTVGAEFQVNTYTGGSQNKSSVTALNDGGFVVTWMSEGQDGSQDGIYGQRYNAAGAVSGVEFQVNTHTTSDQSVPSVTALADGGFVVTWYSVNQDGSGNGIYGQRYDAAGAVSGVEFQVNTHTTSDQSVPSVTALADGGFVVIWESGGGQDGSNDGIYGQRYDAAGVPVGGEVQINTHTLNNQEAPSVTGLDDGGFVVTWQSYDQDGANSGIYAQLFSAQLVGTPDADTITGTAGADSIDGLAGDDTILGGDDEDTVFGREGADVLRGGNDNDRLYGGANHDQLYGDAGADYVDGGSGRDELRGGAGEDRLYGRTGTDILAGNDGADTLYGGDDNDRLFGGQGDDNLNGGSGDDFISGGADNDVLRGNTGNDDLNGDSGADTLAGNSGADNLDGGSGDDRLFGGIGDDVLAGGSGNDSLNGGAGADQFVFTTLAGLDTVQDFEDGTDLIRYDGGVYTDLTIVASGADVDITSVSGGHMLLLDTAVADVTEADFVFV